MQTGFRPAVFRGEDCTEIGLSRTRRSPRPLASAGEARLRPGRSGGAPPRPTAMSPAVVSTRGRCCRSVLTRVLPSGCDDALATLLLILRSLQSILAALLRRQLPRDEPLREPVHECPIQGNEGSRAVGELNVQDRVAGLEIDVLHAAGIQVPRDLASPEVEDLDPVLVPGRQPAIVAAEARRGALELLQGRRTVGASHDCERADVSAASDSSRISNRPDGLAETTVVSTAGACGAEAAPLPLVTGHTNFPGASPSGRVSVIERALSASSSTEGAESNSAGRPTTCPASTKPSPRTE